MSWCDFFVKCEEDYHLERIHFDVAKWEQMKSKRDVFFFAYVTAMFVLTSEQRLNVPIKELIHCLKHLAAYSIIQHKTEVMGLERLFHSCYTSIHFKRLITHHCQQHAVDPLLHYQCPRWSQMHPAHLICICIHFSDMNLQFVLHCIPYIIIIINLYLTSKLVKNIFLFTVTVTLGFMACTNSLNI